MKSNYINGKQSVLVKQRVKTNTRVVIMFAAAFALLIVPQAPRSYAASVNNSPNTLKISPVRTDISIPAGTSKTVEVTVTNLTKAPITVTPIENDFIAGDERGTPALILDADKYAPTHSLKRYMRPLQNLTIEANKSRVAGVVINVPKDAKPGGYFGAIRFAPTSPEGGGQVNLSASVASLILMTVPGNAVEKLDVTEFAVQQNGVSSSYFQSSNDLQVTARFENKGDVQLGPFGKVSVKQGDKIVYETDFNNKDQRDMVLPDSARRWDFPLKNIGSFGNYTVSATFTYGKNNQTIQVTKSFWVIPFSVILITIGIVVGLILLIVGIWWFLRSYKRRIQKQSHRGYRR